MSHSKGVRLYLRKASYHPDGRIRKRATWVIRDAERPDFRGFTGCAQEDRAGAERALAEYIAAKYKPDHQRDQPAAKVLVTDVLALYAEEVAPKQARPEKTASRILQLGEWWQGKTLADITGRTCRAYVTWRTSQAWKSARPEVTGNAARMVSPAGVRRELEDLRAAVNYHRREGYCREIVEVTLPERSPARQRWLTRSEAARLLWHCWRYREVQTYASGKTVITDKRPRRHLARFILVGLYTGTRAGSIAAAGFEKADGVAWIDLEQGIFHRLAVGRKATNKRAPPVRLPGRLLAHIRRWKRLGAIQNYVVEWNGKSVGEVNKGFASAAAAVGLAGITPHVLRHTAATWLMQNRCDLWEAAGYLGMTVQTLERVYGHHHPDFQRGAADALQSRVRGHSGVTVDREQTAI